MTTAIAAARTVRFIRILLGRVVYRDGGCPLSRRPFFLVSSIVFAVACSPGNVPSPTNQTAAPAPAAAPSLPSGPRVYVTNERSGDLSVIDVGTRKEIAKVPLGKRPRGIRVGPDGKTLYIALSGSPFAPPGVDESTLPPPDRSADGIGVFDTTALKMIRIIHAGTDPEQLAVNKDGTRLFVANEDAALTSVVDLATDKVIATVKVGGEPEGVELNPDGTVVYVTAEEDNEVFAIDAREGHDHRTVQDLSRDRDRPASCPTGHARTSRVKPATPWTSSTHAGIA